MISTTPSRNSHQNNTAPILRQWRFSSVVRTTGTLVLLIIAVIAPAWHLHFINRQMPSSHNDLLIPRVATRAAFRGQNPYSPTVTQEIQTAYYGRSLTPADNVDPQKFAYPAYVALLVFPLAKLTTEFACLAYLIGILPIFAGSIVLAIHLVDASTTHSRTALTLLVVLCSWPVVWAVRLQQLTLLVAVLVFSACFMLRHGHNVAAGVLLAMAMIKPQLVLLLILWLLLWAAVRRLWGFIISFTFMFAVMLVGTEVIIPGWFSFWRRSISEYSLHAALPLAIPFGRWFGLVLTLILVAVGGSVLWHLRRTEPRSPEFATAVALALAISVSCTLTKLPTVYNQILLLPASLILIRKKSPEYYPALTRRIALLLLGWGYLSVSIAVLGETVLGPSALWEALPFQNILLPVVLTLALVFYAATYVSDSLRVKESLM